MKVVRGGVAVVERGVEVVVVDEVEEGEARGDGGGVEVSSSRSDGTPLPSEGASSRSDESPREAIGSWWGVSGAVLASWYRVR